MTSAEDQRTIYAYRDLYESRKLWQQMTWRGYDVAKTPEDMWLYQEAIADLEPQLIVEFGTNLGGTALFYADMLDLLVGGNSKVLSIDIKNTDNLPQHDRLTYHVGHSRHDEAVTLVNRMAAAACGPVLIIEDSDHTPAHVVGGLELYSSLVTVGSYFVCEDCGWPDSNSPTRDAVSGWLSNNHNFRRDPSMSKYMLTTAPDGWLKRIT